MPQHRSRNIRSVIVPAAGLGTRLLSATKEQPKEMLPIFARDRHGAIYMKPMLQEIFEQLFDFGMREFYFIVGREKRAIEDHFTPDREVIQRLGNHMKRIQVRQLEGFYDRIEAATIVWVNQPSPRGFGDAVLRVSNLLDEESFFVNAGDSCVVSGSRSILSRLTEAHVKNRADATLALKEVPDPRQYGVAEISDNRQGTFRVKGVAEKPTRPKTKLAIMPLYVFTYRIFEALNVTRIGSGRELQLTDAIQKLIDAGHRVQAVRLLRDDTRLDVGTPETYWDALKATYRYARMPLGWKKKTQKRLG